ncbi:MAG: ATP-dependent DNA helicase RecG [Pigmentiphaga sp.]
MAKAETPTQRKLAKLGLHTAQDFVLHLPLRYQDETSLTPIGSLRPGREAQTEGRVVQSEVQLRPRRQLVATLADDTGRLGLRFLNFYPSQQAQLSVGQQVRVLGEPRGGLFGLEMIHPRVTRAGTELPETLTPVYPTTQGLPQTTLRRLIAEALAVANLAETLPDVIRERLGLPGFAEAIRTLHQPPAGVVQGELLEHHHPAWQRIKFDELLAQQLSLAEARALRRAQCALPLPEKRGEDGLTVRLLSALPFALTPAQRRVVAEIGGDLGQSHPMQRLLQGDVGSGKTVVAALAAAQAIDQGAQVALMAPTEILAEQHWHKLKGWLEPLGVELSWLSGSLGARAKREALAAIAEGRAQLVVGTQALIQETVQFQRLGLAISDEQHRFGVGQRLALRQKSGDPGLVVHQLMMSATPIPRTLAMTVFADLDVSTIDELPPGRSPVITKLVSDARREEIMARIRQAVHDGRQAYWVCPLVEESEALQLQTAVDTYETLREALPDVRVGLVHGRLPAADKAAVMQAFQAGQLDLLVATTVIEVGVDVANATLMIIEHAERFGLAQLHQLRGRVGRGSAQSACVLLYQSPLSMLAKERLRCLHETQDGFVIAQRDLELRGPGEFLGVRQSGTELLRFADLEGDSAIVEHAREFAAELREYHPDAVAAHLERWARGREDFLRA